MRAVQRRGPESGYDFGNKRHYRRTIWSVFRKACRGYVRDAHALLLPSIEGDEINVALAAGFREQNLHIVDNNPAIVATLKRRFPKVSTYGVDLAAAVPRVLARAGRLDVANVDLCCPAGVHLVKTLGALGTHIGGAGIQTTVAVTVLRGRERDWDSMLAMIQRALGPGGALARDWFRDRGMEFTNLSDMARAILIRNMFMCGDDRGDCVHVEPAWSSLESGGRHGQYRSTAGTQTMYWSIWTVSAAFNGTLRGDPTSLGAGRGSTEK